MELGDRKREIEKLERQVKALRELTAAALPADGNDLARLREEVKELQREFYENMGAWQRVQDDVAVALAAETVGAADRALADAIAYTSERVVFDKPVATYQSVRHRLVEMFQQVEMARAGFQFAAWASDTEVPERAQSAAMAAGYAADAGVRVTGDDIQLHGGVGFTWANDAHFLFKRVKQNEILFGGRAAQHHRLAALFIA